MRKVYGGVALMAAVLLAGCSGEPEWKAVYAQCKETVSEQSEQLKNSASESSDAQTRAMAESMNSMAMNMAMSACEMIRTTCEEDADGPACRAYVEQSRQQ